MAAREDGVYMAPTTWFALSAVGALVTILSCWIAASLFVPMLGSFLFGVSLLHGVELVRYASSKNADEMRHLAQRLSLRGGLAVALLVPVGASFAWLGRALNPPQGSEKPAVSWEVVGMNAATVVPALLLIIGFLIGIVKLTREE